MARPAGNTHPPLAGRRLRASLPLLAGLTVAVAVTAIAGPARAQDAGAAVWSRGACSNCHGNLAEGGGDPAYPQGPSLRRTSLDPDQIKETIACGRPETQMPYHLAGAYTTAACYGLPLGAVPAKTAKGSALTAAQIDDLVAFLVKNVVGMARITRGNCATFNDGNENAPECQQYPR